MHSDNPHPKLLNIGCGNRFHPAWVNIDRQSTETHHVISWNLLKGIPFKENSFKVVYHSHFLEHLTRCEAIFIIKECYRVTSSTGILRVVTPDLEYNTQLYLHTLNESLSRCGGKKIDEHYEWAVLNLIDQMVRQQSGGEMIDFFRRPNVDMDFVIASTGGKDLLSLRRSLIDAKDYTQPRVRWRHRHLELLRKPSKAIRRVGNRVIRFLLGDNAYQSFLLHRTGELHKWLYDRHSLERLLSGAGYTKVRFCEANESSIEGWTDYCLDTDPDGFAYKPHSLFAEATKP